MMRNQNYSPLRGFAVRGGTTVNGVMEITVAGLIEKVLQILHRDGEEADIDAMSLRQAREHELKCQRVRSLEDILSEITDATKAVVRRLPSGDIRLRRDRTAG